MNSNPIRILLVDDDFTMLRSLARWLSEYEFEVESTSCPAEAKAFLHRYPIDVVICDYQMPGQTGLEFLTELRNEHPEMITFMLTGKVAGLPVAEDWAKEIGVHKVFSKPCDIRQIAAALRDAMIQGGVGIQPGHHLANRYGFAKWPGFAKHGSAGSGLAVRSARQKAAISLPDLAERLACPCVTMMSPPRSPSPIDNDAAIVLSNSLIRAFVLVNAPTVVLCLIGCLVGGTAAAADSDASIDFFERKIRPVLVARCYECHSAESDVVQGGLRVDDSRAMIRGGDSGEIILPGQPATSLLIAALRYDTMEMPPDEPLPENVIRDFENWIRLGAAMPESAESSVPHGEAQGEAEIDWQKARAFWAFQRPTLHDPDEIASDDDADDDADDGDVPSWTQTKLDRFVVARLAKEGLSPNAAATKSTWLRRVTFDLIGLPPTIQQVEAFEADPSPMAKQRVVDRLLASPSQAERWSRMWLDVARFAEDQAHIVGDNDSLVYPNAYLYRDWVINAFANDVPYDEFVRTQLASDLIEPEHPEKHVSLGFLGLGPKYYRRNSLEVMADEWEDRIDTVSRGLLGLTVACARCHDHKYDPVPTSDYYAMAGVFASTEMFNRPLDASVEINNGQAKKPQDAMHIVRDGKPQDLNVMVRGDVTRPGEKVQRGFLTVLGVPESSAPESSAPESSDFERGSGRVALADAIVNQSNPLTARVIVNRVWQQLMGTPIVDTPSNFGTLGARPSHPLLLDDLAVRFMNAGWSLKWLQREIVLSAAYGQSSDVDPVNFKVDPDNRLRWRMPRRRLNLEAYRDAILLVSGSLDGSVGGQSIDPQDTATGRRTVYSKVSRLDLSPMLARFDFPDPNAHSPGRHETTTPLQKLFLLNSPFLVHHAGKLADRIKQVEGSDRDRITHAYQLLFAREPSESELRLAEHFVADGTDQRWNSLAQTLLISNEMFMLD